MEAASGAVFWRWRRGIVHRLLSRRGVGNLRLARFWHRGIINIGLFFGVGRKLTTPEAIDF